MNNQDEQLKFWIESAQSSRNTAEDLYRTKHYDACLFFGHLMVEKIIKAKIVSQNQEIPYSHNLLKLADVANITLDDDQKDILNEITTFNIEARYDDYKRSFYYKADEPYAKKWFAACEKIYKEIQGTI